MTLLSQDFGEPASWSESSSADTWLCESPIFAGREALGNERPDKDHTEVLDLVSPYIPSLRRYLQSRVPEDDIDDVLQDVLLRILRRVEQTPIERPKCYLFQAAHATLIDRHRRQKTRKVVLHCELMEEMHPIDDHHPMHILMARDEFRVVEEVLCKLPARTREIIIAVRLEGESLKALAKRYEISTSAIEKHVTKALKALAKSRNTSALRHESAVSNYCCAA